MSWDYKLSRENLSSESAWMREKIVFSCCSWLLWLLGSVQRSSKRIIWYLSNCVRHYTNLLLLYLWRYLLSRITKMDTKGTQYFSGLLQWDTIKILNVTLHCLIMVFGPILLSLAVWYERKIADVVYRTLINQLLSHCFLFQSLFCVISRFSYFVNFCLAPNSPLVCNVSIFFGRYTFVFMTTQITIRQLIKYLYIFNWKHIVQLDDDFMAFFLTLANLLLSLLLSAYSSALGFHNEEVDFHICTGKHPLDNIADFMETIHLPMNKSTHGWLEVRWGPDPIAVYSFVALFIQFLVGIQTW